MNRVKEVQKRFDELTAELSAHGTLRHPNSLLDRAAELWPSRTALVCEDKSLTFKQLRARAAFLAGRLIREWQIEPGSRVLLLYENSIDFYIGYHAAWMAGAIVVPLNTFLNERELTHIIADADPKLIITSPLHCAKFSAYAGMATICESLLDLTQPAEQIPLSFVPHQPDISACTLLLYTSGTTGLPKGVMLSGEAIMTNCMQVVSNFDISAQERFYAALPLFHSYMQNVSIWCALVVGALVIVIPRISRPNLLRGLAQRPTILLGIPQLFGLFCMMKGVSFPDVKLFISGGDAMSPAIKLAFELLFDRRIMNGYGLTETAPLISANLEEWHAPTHCVGRPMVGIKVAIRAEGRDLASGQIGTIWVTGKNLMLGYYNAPEATAEVVQDGWFNTGDLGYLDQYGRLVIAGREKDLIIHHGIKIYPQEVEGLLLQHPHVLMAAVVGAKSGKTEIPVAFIVPHGADENLEQELKRQCQRQLARYKIPQRFYLRKQLPQTATGKIDKKALRAELAQEATSQ